jgi:hypothetical protein
MSGGEWNTRRELKQQAADARELLREQIRLEKRQLRDLRYCAERATLTPSDWGDFVKLHHQHGREGLREFWDLVAYWETCQRMNGGAPCPPDLQPAWLAQIKCKKSAHGLGERSERTRPTTRKAPGSPRKPRTDKGKPRPNYSRQ